jgi:hypothetical protein
VGCLGAVRTLRRFWTQFFLPFPRFHSLVATTATALAVAIVPP